MTLRRNVCDPLEPTKERHWLEIRDRHSRLIEGRPLPPGAHLKRAFVLAMLEHIDAGRLENFSSTSGTFFCAKYTERRQGAIAVIEPGVHAGFGAAPLCECPGRQHE